MHLYDLNYRVTHFDPVTLPGTECVECGGELSDAGLAAPVCANVPDCSRGETANVRCRRCNSDAQDHEGEFEECPA